MLRIFYNRVKAVCCEDLSHLEGKISSDIYEERYPVVGKAYKINAIYVMNELRDSAGRCIPRSPWDITKDIRKIHLFGWTSEMDVFEEQEGFDMSSFIYCEQGFSDSYPYEWFKRKGVNIRLPGWENEIQKMVEKGMFKRNYYRTIEPYKSQYKAIKNIGRHTSVSSEGRAFSKMQKQEMSPGGKYYDKPYYDLQVKGGRVVEPGKESKSLILSVDL